MVSLIKDGYNKLTEIASRKSELEKLYESRDIDKLKEATLENLKESDIKVLKSAFENFLSEKNNADDFDAFFIEYLLCNDDFARVLYGDQTNMIYILNQHLNNCSKHIDMDKVEKLFERLLNFCATNCCFQLLPDDLGKVHVKIIKALVDHQYRAHNKNQTFIKYVFEKNSRTLCNGKLEHLCSYLLEDWSWNDENDIMKACEWAYDQR